MMADCLGTPPDSAGSGKWERFEDEDDNQQLRTAVEDANKVITGHSLGKKLLDGLSPIENGIAKSALCEDVKNSVASENPPSDSVLSGKSLEASPDLAEIKSSDRDISTTPSDRSLADSLGQVYRVHDSETMRGPSESAPAHSDLENRSDEIPNKARSSVADANQAELEKKRTKWTFFDESYKAELSAKATVNRPHGGLLDSQPGVNMANGSTSGSKQQPPKTVVPSGQGFSVLEETKPTKNWVSFGELGMENVEVQFQKETTSGNVVQDNTEHSSEADQKPSPISTDLSRLTSIKPEGQARANAGGEVSNQSKGIDWVNFDERPPASETSISAQDSWVTFESAAKTDVTSLTVNVGLSPQASPVSTSSPNPFVSTSSPQGVNPFKPSHSVLGTNPFQVGESPALPIGGQAISGLQVVEPPFTKTVKPMITVDELDGAVAASDAICTATEEDGNVKAEEDELLGGYPVLPTNNSWSLLLRFPDKKRRIVSREWKPVVIKLEGCTLQIYEDYELSAPFREVPLQGYFSFSTSRLQSHERGGKVHTVKLEYVKYKEGRKLNHKGNIEHIPCATPILKLGSKSSLLVREFMEAVTHSLRFLPFYRDRGITYSYDEMFVDVDDVCDVLLAGDGTILKQSTKVLIRIRAFLTGDPECQLVLNDAVLKRREEERLRNEVKPQRVHHWIKVQQCEFHKCVDKSMFEESHAINFHPLDACTFELMRFQVKNNKPLPLEVKASLVVLNEQRIELKAEIQLCQEKKMAKYARNNVVFRFPIPDTWVALFRTSKMFRGEKSIKSTRSHRTGIKSRLHNSKCSIVVSLGSAKYEPEYAAVVWRMEKLPFIHSKVPVDAPQTLICQLDLPQGMECPVNYKPQAEVEYDVGHALVSDTTVIAIKASDDNLPDKWICYRALYHYHIDMDVSRPTSSPVRDVGCTQQ